MPTGTITTNTLAPGNVDGAAEATVLPVQRSDRAALVAGTNTIAVEVHQNSRTSSDISFDLALDAEVTRRRRRHDQADGARAH